MNLFYRVRKYTYTKLMICARSNTTRKLRNLQTDIRINTLYTKHDYVREECEPIRGLANISDVDSARKRCRHSPSQKMKEKHKISVLSRRFTISWKLVLPIEAAICWPASTQAFSVQRRDVLMACLLNKTPISVNMISCEIIMKAK